jgi:hypothetical protein
MADQDSPRNSFWTSLPGILTGAAALITAVSGLAIWHSNSASQTAAPAPSAVVQQSATPAVQPSAQPPAEKTATAATPSTASAEPGSKEWCAEKYKTWADEKATSGVDDAGLRKELTKNHCNQYGFILGKVKPE